MTYLLLSVAFLVPPVATLALAARRRRLPWAALALAAATLLVLTAVFDTLMIAAGLFTYADEHLAGPRLGRAPVEDLAYPLAAVLGLPALWALLGRERHGRR